MIKGTTPGKCFFCGNAVIARNKQSLPTCGKCKNQTYHPEQCPICKGWLEEKQGKYGAYFICGMHGNWSAARLQALDAK